ncbi:MAG: lipoate--protein ligase, partial [Lachnospiraceae bacterium]|nr:lipoate--protein ligase [Lachnospiraceae bacterium]
TVDEKKFSGNAYYESGEYAYHHGCIMVNANKENLSSYLNVSEAKLKSKGVSSVKSRVMNLSEASSVITVQSLKNALMGAFTKVYGYDYDMITLSEGDKAKIDELRNKYASEEWRFGQKIPFTQNIEHRFSFGEVQLLLDVNEGRINNVKVNTDSMDTSISGRTEKALTGMMYRKEELLLRADDESGEVEEILLYLCEII